MVNRDARSSGRSLDRVSGPPVARRMERLAGETRGLGHDVGGASREVDRAQRSAAALEHRAVGLGRETQRARVKLGALGRVVGLLKWPALIAGIGGAVQALGGVAAGAVALLPKLFDLGGATASGGVLLAGVGAAMGTTRLAMSGLAPALAGNVGALKRLTPQGRAFVALLRSYRPELSRLRETAQRGMLPGVGSMLEEVRAQAPALRSAVGQTSRDLGGLARFAGRQIAAPGATRDLAVVADEGSRALGAAARTGFYLAHALEQALLAAGPFTDWLGDAVERLARSTDAQAAAAGDSGALGVVFARGEAAVRTVADVSAHLFGGLRGLMRAARGQSDSLWQAIDQRAAGFDDWANSVGGQVSMRRWFDDTRPGLAAAVGLVGDVGKAIGSLTTGPEGAAMMTSLRGAIPSLSGGVQSLTSSLGPAVIDAVGSTTRLLGDLAVDAGPLALLAGDLQQAAAAADAILHGTGAFGHAIEAAIVTGWALSKTPLGPMFVPWWPSRRARELKRTRRKVQAAVERGDRRQLRKWGLSEEEVDRVLAGPETVRLPAAVTEAERPMLRAAVELGPGEIMTRSGIVIPPNVRSVDAMALAQEEAVAAESEPGILLRARGMLGGAAAGAGRFLGPMAAVSALMSGLGTKGGIGDRLQGALSGATFGIIPAPVSADERAAKGSAAAGRLISALPGGSSVEAQRAAIGRLTGDLRSQHAIARELSGGPFVHVMNAQMRASNDALEAELRRRQGVLEETLRAQRQQVKAKSIEHGDRLSEDLGRAFEIRAHAVGPVAAMDKTTSLILHATRSMRPAGAKVLDDNMLRWARQQAKANPVLLGQVKKLETEIRSTWAGLGRHVAIVNATVLTGSTTEWKGIRTALATQTERAREDVSSDFTAIERQAVGSLTAMGFSASEARQLVRGAETRKGRRTLDAAESMMASATNAGERQSARNVPGAVALGNKRALGGRVLGRPASSTQPSGARVLARLAMATAPAVHAGPPSWPARLAGGFAAVVPSSLAQSVGRAAPALAASDPWAMLATGGRPWDPLAPLGDPPGAPVDPGATLAAWLIGMATQGLGPAPPADVPTPALSAPSRPTIAAGATDAPTPPSPHAPGSSVDLSAEALRARRLVMARLRDFGEDIAEHLGRDASAVKVDESKFVVRVDDRPVVPTA